MGKCQDCGEKFSFLPTILAREKLFEIIINDRDSKWAKLYLYHIYIGVI
jgi:hypothetical protein